MRGGLSLVRCTPRQVSEARLRREFEDAGETLERVIALHLPGQIQGAFDRYVAAARAVEGIGQQRSKFSVVSCSQLAVVSHQSSVASR